MTTTPHIPHTARRLRALAAGSALVFALGALSGCALLPGLPGLPAGGAVDSELVGTTWSGIDSDGDSWGLELQGDGTVGLNYNDSSYDDAGDTWSHSGDTITMHIGFDDGDVVLVGDYAGLDAPMETNGSYDGGTFTVTLTRG